MKRVFALLLSAMLLLTSICGAMAEGVTHTTTVEWDGAYDVVVIGFGGAGAIAAKNAAEAGAKVLIVEKAPEGHEGGNTRYCGQLFVYGNGNVEDTKAYYKALAGTHEIPEAMFNLYTEKIANLADILAEELDFDKNEFVDGKDAFPALGGMSPEYPELPGAESIELWLTHDKGFSDGHLWQQMRTKVVENGNIDVWFESPAMHLIQEPQTKTILGVQVERGGEMLNIKANNGVVMAMGGFENNPEMVETYLGLTQVALHGTIYNTGDGVRMAQEIGADMWHMHVFESLGNGLGSTTFITAENELIGVSASYLPACNTGSAMLIAGDGSRFLNETSPLRHGHIKHGDVWKNPSYPDNMYVVLSEENYQSLLATGAVAADYAYTYTGSTVDELAAAIGADAAVLSATVANFNTCAENGVSDQFGRSAETMKAYPAEGPYYAMKVIPAMLNTQGGARRNENAEVLDTEGKAIPHLYSAGEFGGICSNQYQGGGNIAECIIFGQIAGANAAAAKEALPEGLVTDVMTNAQYTPGVMTDIVVSDYSHIELGENEYLGIGEGGMGGNVVVKAKIVDGKLEAVEVVEHAETPGISDPAFAKIPEAVIAAQSTEVDTIGGCTLTSRALIAAIQNAMDSAK